MAIEVDEAIWRELGSYYTLEHLPHEWSEDWARTVLDKWAAGSAWRLGRLLTEAQQAEAAQRLHAMAQSPEADPLVQRAGELSNYDWFWDARRREILVALLTRIAAELAG